MIGSHELTEQELELAAKYLCISLEELKAMKPEMNNYTVSLEHDVLGTRLHFLCEVSFDAR